MKKINVILIFIVGLFMFKINANSLTYGGCEYSLISRLKSLVSNINIYYDYNIIDNNAYFDVTIINIPEDVYFEDTYNNVIYNYHDADNGVIQINNYKNINSGSYKFYSLNSNCNGILLGTKYYNFPIYNRFYMSDLCEGVKNYSLCQKWVKVDYNYDDFEKMVNNYKEDNNESEVLDISYQKNWIDKVVELYLKYYYLVFGLIILICFPILIIMRKKNKII